VPNRNSPANGCYLFGSFRHFPNVEAYRFFTEQIWPLLRDKFPQMTLTVVCGADPLTSWRSFFADSPEPVPDERIQMLDFVSDVRPLYVEANLVIVPTTVSAGTKREGPRSDGDEACRWFRPLQVAPASGSCMGRVFGLRITPEAFAPVSRR